MMFKRKKKTQESVQAFQLLNDLKLPLIPFGENISNSDVVMICIDRISSACGKLKMRYVKKNKQGQQSEKNGEISYLLKYKPNELMTPYQFLYKIISLLLLNDNCFIYPLYDNNTSNLIGIYPLTPKIVEPIEYSDGSIFLKFIFEQGKSYLIPYENIIHLKKFYSKDQIFGGTSSRGNHESILKVLKINDAMLQGVEAAMFSSFQVKGLLKINGMLKETDKQKQVDEFNRLIKTALKTESSVIPIDGKADYVPLSVDPKIVDEKTLSFIQNKILDYFGVSINIFNSSFNENEFNAFYESTIEPLAIQLSEVFSIGLLTKNQLLNDEQIIFFSERLQYASWTTKVSAIEKLMGLGIMSLNESRALLGLEPVENGNKRLQSLNYVDASKANKYQVNEEDTNKEEINDDTK